ncbi:MAG: amylo-alpha-1,6-glucosidase [Brevinematia bacterium]
MRKAILTILITFVMVGLSYPYTYDKFFETSKVILTNKDIRSFVFTDRVDGYFESKTFSYTAGEGYKVKNTVIFRDFVSTQDEKALNRKDGEFEVIYPSFFETHFKNAKERMFIIQGKQYVIIQVESEIPSKLGIISLLNWFKKDISVKSLTNGIVIKNEKISGEVPSYTIILANQEISLLESTNILSQIRVSPNFGNSGLLQSKENTKSISFVVVFSKSEEEGIKKATEVIRDISSFIENYKKELASRVLGSPFETNLKENIDKPIYWLLYSSDGFVVEEFGKGIWAGLPWFKNNWGRDTFISLAGCTLVNGNFKDAKEIVLNFGNYQDIGNLSIEITSDDKELLKNIIEDVRKINKNIGIRKTENKVFITVPSFLFSKSFSSSQELISKSPTLTENKGKYEIKEIFTKTKTFGRVPNLISSETSVQYNTTDGTPWFIREVMEYIDYSGDLEFIKVIYNNVKTAIEGAIENFVDEDGLLTHDDADTWMDARIEGKESWSPRGNRAVEIQALWINSLEIGIKLARYMKDKTSEEKWLALYKKAKENFVKLFWDEENKRIADRIRKDGFKDFKVRPNMLMVVSLPKESIVGEEKEIYILKNAITELLFPYGIASLSPKDEFFHPWHEKWELYHKDSAYHNGTVWIWNTGFTITSLIKFGYVDLAYRLFTNTLNQVINEGYIGTLSELIDAVPQPNGKIKLSGTYSQAWSVAELSRVWYQDFIGFKPRLLENKIILSPSIPEAITNVNANLRFNNNYLNVIINNTKNYQKVIVSPEKYSKTSLEFIYTDEEGNKYSFTTTMTKKLEISIDKKNKKITLNGKEEKTKISKGYVSKIGKLDFTTPYVPENNVVKEKDYLKSKILKKEWY